MDQAAKPPNVEGAVRRTPPMKCPHCGKEIAITTADLADGAFLLRTQCERCGKEFLIVEGVPMTDEQYASRIHGGPKI